jgi:hypothetical protein
MKIEGKEGIEPCYLDLQSKRSTSLHFTLRKKNETLYLFIGSFFISKIKRKKNDKKVITV